MRLELRLVLASLLLLAAHPASAVNNEPPACLSPDPALWPARARPYFMLAVDTSSSMALPLPFDPMNPTRLGPAPSACASRGPMFPGNRSGNARCALLNTLQTFSGQVSFGIAGFPVQQSACGATCACANTVPLACFTSCSYSFAAGDANGCGPIPGANPANRQGANILVPIQQDNFWTAPPPPSNAAQLVDLVDNACGNNRELWATAKVPLNGMLRDLYRYFAGSYVNPLNAMAVPSPLDPTNERACRSINVILITSGDENCDTFADATVAATNLYNGVTVGNFTWQIRTHVIAFVGGRNAAVLAGAGASSTSPGTTAGHGYYANPTDSVSLMQAIAAIVGSTLSPEVCDNNDNIATAAPTRDSRTTAIRHSPAATSRAPPASPTTRRRSTPRARTATRRSCLAPT